MQVDINRLKSYEIEEGFKELTYDAFEKNGALLKFIQSILSQIQENRVDASADMEKRAIELLTSEFSRLITAYLEDESFLDRLDEYVALAFSGTSVETPTVKAEQQETPEKKTQGRQHPDISKGGFGCFEAKRPYMRV